MHEWFRDVLLAAWAHLSTKRAAFTLTVCVLLAAAGVLVALRQLEFKPERSDLVPASLDWNHRYKAYKQNFPRWDDLVIALEGEPDDPRIDRLARGLASHLEDYGAVAAADAGFNASMYPRLFRTADRPEFEAALGQIQQVRALAAAPNVNAALASMLQQQDRTQSDEEIDSMAQLAAIIEPFLHTAQGTPAEFALPETDDLQWTPFATGTGRIRFVWVQLTREDQSFGGMSAQIAWLRAEIDHFLASMNAADVPHGVTGIQAMEADETAQAITDSTRASILAIVLITILMIIVFRGVSVPLLATGSLLLALGWSFGWAVLSVGHLQLLSVVFCVILMGLGIDFALHIVARLELIAKEDDDLSALMPRVFQGVGPGVLTGAITTAAAFTAIALTDFRGAAEMGIIAGGGIVLCLIAVMSAFPALLALTGRWKQIIRHRHGGEEAHFMTDQLAWVSDHPKTTLTFALLTTAGLVFMALQVRYDPNVMNLPPRGIESVHWEERLTEEDARSAWAALVVVKPEDALEVADRLRSSPEVEEVGGIGMLFPRDREERERLIVEARHLAPAVPPVPGGHESMLFVLSQLRDGLAQAAANPSEQLSAAKDLIDSISGALVAAGSIDEGQLSAAWEHLNESFLAQRDQLQSFAQAALAPGPVGPNDLPEALRSRWIGADGSFLLRIEPAPSDRPVLDPDRLETFVAAVRDLVPDVLGPPVQIYESSRLIQRAYIRAALYALAAILIVLLIDFRSLTDAVSAMIPVVLGFVGVFGLMAAFNVALNFANMIVMPIILGIGVAAGVHMVHRWRADPTGRPAGLSGGTGRGITLTLLTTIIGFACMMIAEHRGIRSLGFVMTVGLVTTLIACYVVLPAILHVRKTPPATTG